MGGVGPGSAREEAERLVATVLGAVRLAADGARSGGAISETLSSVLNHTRPPGAESPGDSPPFATGSAECCVCPVCRAITALRDPDPEFAERLATGAADLATGVAGLLRAFAGDRSPGTGRPGPTDAGDARDPGTPDEPAPDVTGVTPGDVWRQATRSGHDCPSPAESSGRTEDTEVPRPEPETATGRDVRPAPPASGEPPAASAGTRPAVPASREPSEAPVARPADGD